MKTATARNESPGYHWMKRLKKVRSLLLSASSPEPQASAEMTVIYCAMGHGFIRVAEKCDPPSEAIESCPQKPELRGLPAAQ